MRCLLSFLILLSMPIFAESINKEIGKSVYEHNCIVCHENGVAGAPKIGDTSDWKTRQEKKDLDALTASAINGLNAMPAKGTCQTCTDDEIKAAIDYMMPSK